MLKRLVAFLVTITIITVSLPVFAIDYDEVGAYRECYTLYPDFVQRVINCGTTEEKIVYFLGCVEQHILSREEVLSEENFDEYMFDAIQYAFNLRKNISVRNALAKAYPDSVPDSIDGIVTDEFMPIYITVKRYLFGIKTPVVTLSANQSNEIFAHYVNLPEDCVLFLKVSDSEGTLLHSKIITPDNGEDMFECSCIKKHSATLYAWDKASLAPICEPYKLEF